MRKQKAVTVSLQPVQPSLPMGSLTQADVNKFPTLREAVLPRAIPFGVRGQRGSYSALPKDESEGLYLRLGAIFLTESPNFEYLALLTITINCITMALDYPVSRDGPPNPNAALLEDIDRVFLVLYTAEMGLKMLAFGVFHCDPTSWWCNKWALFEGTIVAISWTPFVPFLPNIPKSVLSVLRALRSLRVLRALFIIPGMKELIQSTLEALPALASVLALWSLVVWMMGIVGTQLFLGGLHKRCALPEMQTTAITDPVLLVDQFEYTEDGSPVFCRGGDRECPNGTVCQYFSRNPKEDTLSFDSVIDTIYPLIHTLIGDAWSDNMYIMMSAGFSNAWAYFCPLAALGGFVLVQLFLAVISNEFVEAENKRKQLEKAARCLQAWYRGRTARKSQSTKQTGSQEGSRKTFVVAAGVISERAKAVTQRATDAPKLSQEQQHRKRRTDQIWGALSKLSTLVVLYNVVVMCLEYHGETAEWKALRGKLADVATWFFIVEMGIKLVLRGWREYWADGWNVLDGSLVLSSLVEIVLNTFFKELLAKTGSFTPMLRMLRMLRIIRTLKAARAMPTLQKMIKSFQAAIPQVLNLLIFMFVVMFIFAIIGMQLFGATGMSEISRLHFDNFPAAMISVLTILLGKYVSLYEAGFEVGQGLLMAIYLYTACAVLFLTIMNLFVGILVQALTDDSTDAAQDEPKAGEANESTTSDSTPTKATGLQGFAQSLVGPAPDSDEYDYAAPLPETEKVTWWHHLPNRRHMFDQVLLVLIIISSLMIAVDVPRLPSDSPTKLFAENLANFMVAVFTLEMLIKLAAWGPSGYFSIGWNILDGFIVVISLVSLIIKHAYGDLEVLLTLRMLRVLRPLRLLSRNEGTKLVMTLLFDSFNTVSVIAGVVLFMMVVFAIVGMFLFRGAFGACTDPRITLASKCVGVDSAGEDREWLNPGVGNFDSFGNSMLALFQSMTADTFPDLIFHGMDAVGVDKGPQPTDWNWNAVYFIAWIVVGNSMALNLFVGAIVDNFITLRAENDGSAMLTPAQRQWVRMTRMSRHLRASKRAGPPTWPAGDDPISTCAYAIRVKAYKLVLDPNWQNIMLLLVILNLNLLAFDFYEVEQYETLYMIWKGLAEFFFYWYWAEFALKFIGLGPNGYFSDGGRCFEFAMLMLSVLERTTSVLRINPMVLRVLRLSRVLKTLKLLSRAEDLRALLNTLIASGPALVNVILVLGIFMFIYAVLGIKLFTYVMRNQGFGDHANFETFGGAFLLLFQVLTGDDWSATMRAAMVNEDHGCDPNSKPSNCGSWVAVPYFISYVLISNFIFLNLIVAVIVESFSAAKSLDEEQTTRRLLAKTELVTEAHLADFIRKWSWFDLDADNKIHLTRLPYLIALLKYPLGLQDKPTSRKGVQPASSEETGALAEPEANNKEEQDHVEALIQLRKKGGKFTWTPSIDEKTLSEAKAIVDEMPIQPQHHIAIGEEKLVSFSKVIDNRIRYAFLKEIEAPDPFMVLEKSPEQKRKRRASVTAEAIKVREDSSFMLSNRVGVADSRREETQQLLPRSHEYSA